MNETSEVREVIDRISSIPPKGSDSTVTLMGYSIPLVALTELARMFPEDAVVLRNVREKLFCKIEKESTAPKP